MIASNFFLTQRTFLVHIESHFEHTGLSLIEKQQIYLDTII